MNAMRFSAEAHALGQKLLDHHHEVCGAVSNPASALTDSQVAQNTIRYGTLCERAGIWELRRISGGLLHEIAVWCEQQGWPPINALVVNESGIPGEGYDRAPGGGYANWPDQVRNAIVFKQYPKQMPQ